MRIKRPMLCVFIFPHLRFVILCSLEEKSIKNLFFLSIPDSSSWSFILGTVISRKHCYLSIYSTTYFLGRNRISILRNIGQRCFGLGKEPQCALVPCLNQLPRSCVQSCLYFDIVTSFILSHCHKALITPIDLWAR